ncbi:Serine/threonine-protein phosphatase 2A 65 kDa regulatory subunit A beta isoform [Capsicum chinense]|nr:Serine/threonine-protein phosphatase 2A 65 kDa regulatory subunit A beta isoform [Capsicum chinense]
MTIHDGTIYDVAVLSDEMKIQNYRHRLNSMNNLSDIAQALGAERTRTELIPFLTENTHDDEEEVLLRMIEQLGLFIPYVGGIEHASVLLPPLEYFCTTEETCVRDKAIEILCKIGSQMSQSDMIESFFPMLERLADGEWFTDRISTCGLIHIAYPHAPEPVKNELRTLYRQLCHDDESLVREAAAINLEKFAATIERPYLSNDIMSMIKDLTKDDQYSVRSFAFKSCANLRKLLEPSVFVQELLPIIVESAQDEVWPVRFMVADQLLELCDAVGPELTRTIIVKAYVHLVRDKVVEVRTTGAGKVTKFCQRLSPEIAFQHILPCVKALSSDSSHYVRAAVSSDIVGLAPILGKDATIEHLLPVFHSLLKDSSSEVRWNITSKLDQINQEIGIELLSQTLLADIVELTAVRHSWRIRHAIIEFIPIMASHLGVGIYNDVLGVLCIQSLKDKVCAVREAAVQNLKRLAEMFGQEWASAHIIPQVLNVVNDKYSLYRMNVLDALLNLAPVMGSEITCSQILPVTLAASKDSVPNCRSYVAKVLKSLASVVDQSAVEKSIRPCLYELKADSDPEVVYFAKEALQEIDQVKDQRGLGSLCWNWKYQVIGQN